MPEPGLRLDPALEEQLVDELAEALEEMVRRSCPSMAPLWHRSTHRARSRLGGALPDLGFEPSRRVLQLGGPAQTKYASLACWRHAVLWRSVLRWIEDADFQAAVEAVYFTPYPADEPPFAWSRGASRAPDVSRFPSASTLKEWAKEGSWLAVSRLRHETDELRHQDGSLFAEIVAELLSPAVRRTVRDVLKLEEHWTEAE